MMSRKFKFTLTSLGVLLLAICFNFTGQTAFTANPSISGRVTTGGQSASGVEVRLEGLRNSQATTNSNGSYSFTELSIGGNYTVRPAKSGYYFTPRSKVFNSLTSDATADFTMSLCSYTLSTESITVGSSGGTQIIQVTTNDPFCTWTATGNSAWVTITSGATGTGNGTVRISIGASGENRSAIVTIGSKTLSISQSGCSITLTPFQQSFSQTGGTESFTVNTNESFCQWTAAPSDPWITINGATSGTGNGVVSYTVGSTTQPRAGRISVGNRNFAVFQEANYCSSPAFAAVTPAGFFSGEANDIVSGDFNADGFADFLTADDLSIQSGYFSTFLNINGTLSRNDIVSNVGEGYTLVTGNFNQDPAIDFAIQGAGRIGVFQNNGAGSFTPLTYINQGGGESSELYADDFNHDGKTDILVGYGSQIVVYTNNGAGSFTNTFTLNLTGVRASYSYAFADFNGDGQTDVAVGQDIDFVASQIKYFFGTNVGTFVAGGTFPVSVPAFIIKAADLNNDRRADLVATGINAASVFIHLWNPIANSFNPFRRAFTETYFGSNFELADMDNDGKIDIITYRKYAGNRINILRGNGNGTFRLPIGIASSSYINAIAFGDINRDGRLDMAYGRGYEALFASQISQCGAPDKAIKNLKTTPFDFDGDGKADYGVVRPSNNTWYVNQERDQQSLQLNFGQTGDVNLSGDYDGDGKTDIAVFRPSNGLWYRLNSSENSVSVQTWGKIGDIPVTGDFDGDDRIDLAVFRPQENLWYWLSSLSGKIHIINFGQFGDQPVAGDFDGDQRSDIAIYRPVDGYWYWLNSSDGEFRALKFGLDKDRPVPADYDGDGKTDFAVFRPAEGLWYITQSSTGRWSAVTFGIDTDVPVPADYDGDGKADVAVFRNGIWYVIESLEKRVKISEFGIAGDQPIPGFSNR